MNDKPINRMFLLDVRWRDPESYLCRAMLVVSDNMAVFPESKDVVYTGFDIGAMVSKEQDKWVLFDPVIEYVGSGSFYLTFPDVEALHETMTEWNAAGHDAEFPKYVSTVASVIKARLVIPIGLKLEFPLESNCIGIVPDSPSNFDLAVTLIKSFVDRFSQSKPETESNPDQKGE